MTTTPPVPQRVGDLEKELEQITANVKTAQRVMTTRAQIAQTPKEVIWTLNKAKLYHYVPVVPAEQRHPVPLLLVFAIMNRPSILDLRPGASFVEYMVKQGYDLYLLDWGAPGPEDRQLKFDDYALEYLPRAIRKVKQSSGSDEFSMLGWCLGAVITTSYAALRPDAGLRNLILLTAPLDFTNKDSISFAKHTDGRYFDIDKLLEAYDNMPGELIDYGSKMLKPVDNFIGNYIRLWDNLDDPRIVESWHAMNTWVNDTIDIAGGAFRQLITELYRENRLMKGTFKLRGEAVHLESIRANVLNVIAEADHITPTCQSETIMPRLTGTEDRTLLRVAGGHIGMMAGSGAVKRTWPKIDAWLSVRSKKERHVPQADGQTNGTGQ